jgi:hypothetical protein
MNLYNFNLCDSRGSVIVRTLASRANNMETVGLSIDMIFNETLHQRYS